MAEERRCLFCKAHSKDSGSYCSLPERLKVLSLAVKLGAGRVWSALVQVSGGPTVSAAFLSLVSDGRLACPFENAVMAKWVPAVWGL